MKDRRVLPSGEIEEWDRPRTIPDDFVYDPEENAYFPPGEPAVACPEYTAASQQLKAEIAEMMAEYRRTGRFPKSETSAAAAFILACKPDQEEPAVRPEVPRADRRQQVASGRQQRTLFGDDD